MLCPRFFVEANWMIASPTGTTLKTNAPDVDPTGVTSSWLLAVLSAHVKEGWLDAAPAVAPAEFMTFAAERSEEHTSELQSLMRNSYAVFCLKTTKNNTVDTITRNNTET